MYRISRRLLSVVLAAALCLSYAPAVSFAEGPDPVPPAGSGTNIQTADSGTPIPAADSGNPAPVVTYTVTVTNGTASAAAVNQGDSVTITAAEGDFLRWDGTGIPAGKEKENPLSFIPEGNVDVTALFKQPIRKASFSVSSLTFQSQDGSEMVPQDFTSLSLLIKQGETEVGSLEFYQDGTAPTALELPLNDEEGNDISYSYELAGDLKDKFTLQNAVLTDGEEGKKNLAVTLKEALTEITVKLDDALVPLLPTGSLQIALEESIQKGEETLSHTGATETLSGGPQGFTFQNLPFYALGEASDPTGYLITYLPKLIFTPETNAPEEQLTMKLQEDGTYLVTHENISGFFKELSVSASFQNADGETIQGPGQDLSVTLQIMDGDRPVLNMDLTLAAASQFAFSQNAPVKNLQGQDMTVTFTMVTDLGPSLTVTQPESGKFLFTEKPKITASFADSQGNPVAAPVENLSVRVTYPENAGEKQISLSKDLWSAFLPDDFMEGCTLEALDSLEGYDLTIGKAKPESGKNYVLTVKRNLSNELQFSFALEEGITHLIPAGEELTVEVMEEQAPAVKALPQLKKAGEVKLSRENTTATLKLPNYSEAGLALTYQVPEIQGKLKLAKNTEGVYVASLAAAPDSAVKAVSLIWQDPDGSPMAAPEEVTSFKVKLLGRAKGTEEAFQELETLELKKADNFTASVNLYLKDLSDREMEYRLEPAEELPLFTPSSQETENALKLTLQYAPEMEDKTVTVRFLDCYGRKTQWPKDSLELTMKSDSYQETLTVSKDGENNESAAVVSVPKTEPDGTAPVWSLVNPGNLTVNGITYVPQTEGLTLTYIAKARINAEIRWRTPDGKPMEEIPKEKLSMGLSWDTGHMTLEASKDSGWMADTVVPGYQAPYGLKVQKVPGYEVTVGGPWTAPNVDYKFVVTIKKAVPVALTAKLDRDLVSMETQRIKLLVFRNNVLFDELELSRANQWVNHIPGGVPKYDPDGDLYTYEVKPVNEQEFKVTGSLQEGFLVERTVPNALKNIQVSIVWKNKKGEKIDAPGLYKKLDVKLSGASKLDIVAEWEGIETLQRDEKWDKITVVPKKDSDGQEMLYRASLESLTPMGYKFSVEGEGTDHIVITLQAKKLSLIPATGDQFAMGLWLTLGAAALVGLGIFGAVNHKKKNKK